MFSKISKFRRAIISVLFGFFGTWVLVSACLHIFHFSSLPKAPDEKNGRIYLMVVKGSDHYGSDEDVQISKFLAATRPVAFVCFLAALTIGVISGDLKVAPGRKLNE